MGGTTRVQEMSEIDPHAAAPGQLDHFEPAQRLTCDQGVGVA